MSSSWRSWFRFGRGKESGRHPLRGRPRPQLEQLEDRTLLSVSAAGGAVALTGTAGNDAFVVQLAAGNQIRFSDDGGATFSAPMSLSDVQSVLVRGVDGQDTLTLDAGNN